MNKDDAVKAAESVLFGPYLAEQSRLNRIAEALKPNSPTVEIPSKAPEVAKRLACKSQTNFLPLILDVLSQGMRVVGYQSANGTENASPWQWWQLNGMDARQTGITRSALAYGASYATVLPGDRGPKIRGVSPRMMTALYQDPAEDDWPMLALRIDGDILRLYDEEYVYFLGRKDPALRSGVTSDPYITTASRLDFIEARPHDLGVCPVVRFRDRMLLEGEEQFGVIEPIMTIQQRIDETTFGMMIAQFYAAFKQRYVIGWVPEDEQEELRASASEMWAFEDPSVKVGSFEETDLTRYLASKASGVRDMAAISQVPAQNLGIDALSNISAETLAGLEAGKDRKVDEITTSLGESWEQLLRAAATLAGDEAAANDFSAQVRWKDATARSLAQTTDALVKWVQSLGVPAEGIWSRLPGVEQQDVEHWREIVGGDPILAAARNLTGGTGAPAVNG